GARDVVASALRGRPALMHHHDLPWQRPQFAHGPPPPDDPAWLHVTINQMSRHQLAAHGIQAVVVRNSFDTDAPPGDGEKVRREIGMSATERLVLQPTRAIPRKNVAGGIALAEELDATFWLPGPPEDGYGPELDRLVSRASCPVVLDHAPGSDPSAMSDAYAACDLVALPSTLEGFGNPAVESAVHRRPLAIGHYPVAAELAAFGFRWFSYEEPDPIRRWLDEPDTELLEHNRLVARTHFSSSDLPRRLARLIQSAGWVRFEDGP
ncbi:MAG: hypothetical protein ACRDV4_02365, partial [Acidimicrobiales bacterium]